MLENAKFEYLNRKLKRKIVTSGKLMLEILFHYLQNKLPMGRTLKLKMNKPIQHTEEL